MEMGGNFCQILELGEGTTIKGRRVGDNSLSSNSIVDYRSNFRDDSCLIHNECNCAARDKI